MALADLTDDELVRRIVSDRDNESTEELVCRSRPRLRATIRKMVFGKQSICPLSEDRDAFLDDAVALASTKLLRSLHAFKRDFDVWVFVIAKQAACDHKRFVTRHTPPATEVLEAIEQEQSRDYSDSPPRFCSAYWADPLSLVHDREIGDVVKALLDAHARKNELSAHAISLVVLHECNLVDAAAKLGTYTRKVRRLLDHDYQELKRLLATTFHVTRLRDLRME